MTLEPLHFSQLKHIAKSPAHYAYNLGQPFTPTAAMRKGTCVDLDVFKPIALKTRPYVVYDGVRNKRHRAYQEFLEEQPDNIIVLSDKEARDVEGCVEAIERHPDAISLLKGSAQRTIAWSFNGRHCEGTPDVFARSYVTELKTTRCSDPGKFRWDAKRMGYHAQLAWYRAGLIECGLASPQAAYIVAVETAPPYPVTCFELSEQALDLGERTWRLWFERLMACEESDEWPAYVQSVVPLDFDDEGEFSIRIGGEDIAV